MIGFFYAVITGMIAICTIKKSNVSPAKFEIPLRNAGEVSTEGQGAANPCCWTLMQTARGAAFSIYAHTHSIFAFEIPLFFHLGAPR